MLPVLPPAPSHPVRLGDQKDKTSKRCECETSNGEVSHPLPKERATNLAPCRRGCVWASAGHSSPGDRREGPVASAGQAGSSLQGVFPEKQQLPCGRVKGLGNGQGWTCLHAASRRTEGSMG
eukprot:scaffold1516_cov363-Pavlova_lutheri.AAC.2